MLTLPDLAFGWFLSKLFEKKDSPAVVFSPAGTAASPQPGATAPAALPAPVPVTTPTFPNSVPVPDPGTTAQPPPGFKRAVEVWQIKPAIANQGSALLSGLDPQMGSMTLAMLEQGFPKGWQGMRSASPQEAAQAKQILATGQWRDGGVLFAGPATLPGRRAFRMTKHPAAITTTASPLPTGPAPASPAPGTSPAVPASASVPAAAPAPAPGQPTVTTRPDGSVVTTLPEMVITPGPDAASSTPAGGMVTTVRRGEGLAQVAKRLGKPETGTSAQQLQAANVPQGPDANWKAIALAKGGLQKSGRAGGLQPGDRLFIPAAWGPVDAARL